MAQPLNIEHFRAKLLQRREEMLALEETRKDAAGTVVLDQTSVGRLSRMDAMQQQAMAKNTRQRAAVELQRIKAALRRCDSGDYGYCLRCDEGINPRRLEFDPAAPLCIGCAEKGEG